MPLVCETRLRHALRCFALVSDSGSDALLSRHALAAALSSQLLGAGLSDQEAIAVAHFAPGPNVLVDYGTASVTAVMCVSRGLLLLCCVSRCVCGG